MDAIVAATLPHIDEHPHARAVLLPALPPGSASHAYLFHGPAGAGKREVARAFAAALLSDGAADPDEAAARVDRGAHPDLTWVSPSGASEMLVADIDEPVVAAATRTPFEAARRVFVIESADAMGEATANRLLKTLEEPADFVHLILLNDAPRRGPADGRLALPARPLRAAERRTDRGAAAARRAPTPMRRRRAGGSRSATPTAPARSPSAKARSCETPRRRTSSRRSPASSTRAPGRPPRARRGSRRARVRGARGAARSPSSTWSPDPSASASTASTPSASRRLVRRSAAATLDLGLGVCELWCRDAAVIAEGAPELVHATRPPRRPQRHRERLARRGRSTWAIDLIADTRERLALNVTEELALEALAYRLAAL